MQLLRIALLGLVLLASPVGAESSATADPVSIASKYLDAMSAADLDLAEALFASESSVFESGGREGSWNDYRSHHLGPEIDAITSFTTTRGEPDVASSPDGGMAFVAWPLEYRIELDDGRVVERKGTVTFVLVSEGRELRIRHLHWSSRAGS